MAAWRDALADPDVRRALTAAAERCMRDACHRQHRTDSGKPTDDPAWCDCPTNRMTPLEFRDWIDDEIRNATRRPVRFERGARPHSAAPLRAKHLQLAVTG